MSFLKVSHREWHPFRTQVGEVIESGMVLTPSNTEQVHGGGAGAKPRRGVTWASIGMDPDDPG